MMFWYGGGWPFWQVAVMSVAWIGFWILVIWALVMFVRAVVGRPEPSRPVDEARRQLDLRLARGEIDADEYRRLRDLMVEPPGSPPGGRPGGP